MSVLQRPTWSTVSEKQGAFSPKAHKEWIPANTTCLEWVLARSSFWVSRAVPDCRLCSGAVPGVLTCSSCGRLRCCVLISQEVAGYTAKGKFAGAAHNKAEWTGLVTARSSHHEGLRGGSLPVVEAGSPRSRRG